MDFELSDLDSIIRSGSWSRIVKKWGRTADKARKYCVETKDINRLSAIHRILHNDIFESYEEEIVWTIQSGQDDFAKILIQNHLKELKADPNFMADSTDELYLRLTKLSKLCIGDAELEWYCENMLDIINAEDPWLFWPRPTPPERSDESDAGAALKKFLSVWEPWFRSCQDSCQFQYESEKSRLITNLKQKYEEIGNVHMLDYLKRVEIG